MTTKTTPKKNTDIKLPIFLMVWPAAALIVTIFGYAIMNFIFSSISVPTEGVSPYSIVRTILNVFLFIIGAAAVAGGFPSFIAGLVLLIIRKS